MALSGLSGLSGASGVSVVLASETPTSIESYTLQNSSNPTANTFTLPVGANSFRLFSEIPPNYQPQTPYQDYFVKINNESVKTIRLYWWQSRYIVAPSGASIGIGCIGGGSVRCHATTLNLDVLPTLPLGAIAGTINSDKAGPPLWTPSAPHVVFDSGVAVSGRILQFPARGTADPLQIFVSEFDGTNWSPVRFYWIEKEKPLTIQCYYRNVAFATYSGASLNVQALGATVGGVSTAMALPAFVVTGQTRNVASSSELASALSAAIAGDEIVLANGTYSLASDIVSTTLGGIQIRSQSNDPSLCILQNGMTLTHPANAAETRFRGITFQLSGRANGVRFSGGRFSVENCVISGPTTAQDLFNVEPISGNSVDCLVLGSRIFDGPSTEDVINGAGAAPAFKGTLINVEAYGSGTAGASQVLTGHLGCSWVCFGCNFSGGRGSSLIANDNVTLNYLYFCNFSTQNSGTTKSVLHSNSFGCGGIIPGPVTTTTQGKFVACCTGEALSNLLRNYNRPSEEFGPNQLIGSSGVIRVFFNNAVGGAAIRRNIFRNCANAVTRAFASVLQPQDEISQNTFAGNTTAFDLTDGNGFLPALLRNNACLTSGTSISTNSASNAGLSGGTNIFDPVVSGSYTARPGDILGVDANLTAALIPVAGGNADNGAGSGQHAVLGDTDWAGLVFAYGGGLPIGARSRPTTGGAIYPDAV